MKKHLIIINQLGDNSHTFTHESPFDVKSILEEVFGMFNHGSGSECELFLKSGMRSLSVHDCVRVDGQWYQCASVGWEPISEENMDALEKKVVEHPNFASFGAWSALQDIMWTERKKLA